VSTSGAAARRALGLIAGGGQFPLLVAESASDDGYAVFAVGFQRQTDPALANKVARYAELKIGQLNRMIAFFQKQGVEQVCFAGAISKPRAMQLRPDFRALRLILASRHKGDDALLRALIREMESEGLTVVQAADFLPDLRGPAGMCTPRSPRPAEWEDLRLGWEVARATGRLDIGQCVVLRSGIVAAVEALEGTDAAILRGCQLAGPGCVVVKTVKPGQDERIDLPSLGLETVRLMREHGATCLGYEAGKTLFFDLQRSIELAAAADIAIVGLDASVWPEPEGTAQAGRTALIPRNLP